MCRHPFEQKQFLPQGGMLIIAAILVILLLLSHEARSLRPVSLDKPTATNVMNLSSTGSGKMVINGGIIEECSYDYRGTTSSVSAGSGVIGFLKTTFVPVGYPDSVPPEYREYQFYNLLQDLCSYMRGLMATQAMLVGLGVGNKDATALQATVSWIFRDGAGMIGSLLFTSLYSQSFGQNIKSYRLFADLINNVGITLEMVAPLYPRHFLLLVCFASVFKALCGVAAGACGAAINEHWGGIGNNISEVLAKNGAQHSIVSLLGLLLSVRFATFVNKTQGRLWSIYALLTAAHVIANTRAMRVLALRSLNLVRFDIVARRAVVAEVAQGALMDGVKDKAALKVAFRDWLSARGDAFSPRSVADAEPILFLLLPAPLQRLAAKLLPVATINFFCPPSLIDASDMSRALQREPNPGYIIARGGGVGVVNVCLHAGVVVEEQARAYFEAALVASSKDVEPARAHELSEHLFPIFYEFILSRGWEEKKILLHSKNAKTFKILRDKNSSY